MEKLKFSWVKYLLCVVVLIAFSNGKALFSEGKKKLENLIKCPDFEVEVNKQKIDTKIKGKNRLWTGFHDPQIGYYLGISDVNAEDDVHYKWYFDDKTDFRVGKYSLVIDLSHIKNKNKARPYSVTLYFTLKKPYEPTKRYRFSGWFKSDKLNAKGRMYIIMWLDGKHTYKRKEFTLFREWEKFSVELTVPPGKEVKSSAVRVDFQTPGAKYWIDGLELVKLED